MGHDSVRDRRAFLVGVGRAAALALGAGILVRAERAGAPVDAARPSGPPAPPTARHHDDVPPPPDAAVTTYAAAVAGASLGAWTVACVYGVFRGGVPFVLAHADGRRAQIDLLRRDDASPPGIATTAAGHLYLVNSGRGQRTTPPDLEAAIHALARALDGSPGDELALCSQAERHRRYPGGVYVVPT